jgi:YebC/PmpR family DNA-binding regulatory protein
MAGHSKWSKIKHKKGLNDAKRGKIFSKYAQQIAIAARDGGGDPDSNFTLRLLIDKAKAESMPLENIKRAVDRGTGKSGETINVEKVTYEGFGPGGVSVIVETLTENKNRTVSEVRQGFASGGGNIGDSGSVAWNFDQMGMLEVRPAKIKKSEKFGGDDSEEEVDIEEAMMVLMEIEGILDIKISEEIKEDESSVPLLIVYTGSKDLGAVRDSIKSSLFLIRSAELVWVPKNFKEGEVSIEKVEDFIEVLEDIEDVQRVFTDVEELQ